MNDSIRAAAETQGVESPIPVSPPFNTHSTPPPRTFEGKEYYGAADIAKILGVDKTTVLWWNRKGLFTADVRVHDGTCLYLVERVMQLKDVYRPDWSKPACLAHVDEPETPTPAKPARTSGAGKMKKVSDRTIERLRTISLSQLIQHEIIKAAPDYNSSKQSGLVCPLCDSGERGGTGAATFDANNRLYCHACRNEANHGHKLSTIDLFAMKRNLQHESFREICRQMCAEFNEDLEEEALSMPRRNRNRNKLPPPSPPKQIDPAELKLIRADLQTSCEPLKQFVEEQGGLWRGLPIDILIRFGCRYVAKWTSLKSRIEKKYTTPMPRILIPSGGDFYLARFCGSLDDFDESTRKFVDNTKKLNAGSPQLFNREALDFDKPIFAVEGAIDAMSLEYVGYRAVALNSVSNGNLLVEAVAQMPNKPRVIVLMDSDEQGRKAAQKLYEGLISIDVPCCVRFLFDDTTKADANDILITNGVDNLRGRLESIYDGALAELDAVAVELERRKLDRIDDALIDFLFQGGAKDDDFADRLKAFCGDEIRWVKGENRWLIFERNDQGGAVWTDGGEQSYCLLPQARKMADVMAEHADTKKERELAEKFRDTQKKMRAIAALRGIGDVIVTADDINQHPELLNVRNGVIDLTTGKFLNAAPELLLSQQAAAVFNPNCEDMTFADFFKSVLPDEATRAAVKSYLGYCLTADVSAEKYLLIYGKGGNGKGVLLLTLRTLLKDFAVELPVDTVLENRGRLTADTNGRATTELTPLVNRRLGIVDELPRGARFDVAKVNRLTGRDYLPIRLLRHEFKDVIPTHKLIMTGNYRPQIDDTRDDAILRRLIVVNFAQDFTKNPDVTLKGRLMTEAALSGALNFLLPAAVEFYRNGLLEPSPLMKRARNDFLDENDFIGDFISEYYETGAGDEFTVPRKVLLKHLRDTCTESARYRDADLVTMLEKIDGVTLTKDRTKTNVFRGIRRASKKTEPQQGDFEGEIISSADLPFD